MFKHSKYLLLTAAALTTAACGDDDDSSEVTAGPIDGTWALSETLCDGQAAQSPPYRLAIDNTKGTFALTLTESCKITYDEDYSYDAKTFTITPTAVSCATADGCSALTVSCEMLPPPIAFQYAITDGGLKFTKASNGPMAGDPCQAGQEITFTMISTD